MLKHKAVNVTVRVRIGESEIEVNGPQEYVDKRVQDFIAASRAQPPIVIPTAQYPSKPTDTSPSRKPLSAAQFFKMHAAKSDVDRVLIAGYFLEKHRNAENFSAADIRSLIAEAKVQPPINPSDAINKNIKKANMMPAGEREKKLVFVVTSDGETAAEQMLLKNAE